MLALLRDDSAQGVLEYALIITFVAVVAVVVLQTIGGITANSLSSAGNGF